MITHEVDGLLVMPHNLAALAEAARRVLTDDAYRMRLACAGREKVVRQFNSRIGAELLYTRLFGHAPPAKTNQ